MIDLSVVADRGPPRRRLPVRTQREVGRVLSIIAEEAAQLPEPYVRALRPILSAAQAELARDLAAWLQRHARDGEQRFTAQRYRVALLQLGTAMRALEARVPADLQGVLRRAGHVAGDAALLHLAEEVTAFAAVFGQSVRPLQLRQAAVVARGDKMLAPRHRTSAARYGGMLVDDLRRQLALGVVRGETLAELTARLVRHGGPRGLVALRGVVGEPGAIAEHIAEGLFARYRPWAARIVRTETLNAYNVHHLNGLEEANAEDPGYQKRWDASLDRRMCKVCGGLDAKVVELDAKFPGGHVHPPAHPNCRCALTPWRKEWGGDASTATTAKPPPPPKPVPRPVPKPPPARPAAPPPAVASPTPAARPATVAQVKQSFARDPVTMHWAAASGELADARADRASAQVAPQFSRKDLDAALGRGDGAEVRYQVRGALHEAGVLPRDGLRPEGGRLLDIHLPPGTRGQHHWDGRIDVQRGLLAQAARGDVQALRTIVHEELHGATPYVYISFYRNAGAALEEATVEMAARRIVGRMTGGSPLATGSYQPTIDRVARILHDELGAGVDAEDLIGSAGIRMRAPGAAIITSEDEMVTAFVDAIGATGDVRRRLLDRLGREARIVW